MNTWWLKEILTAWNRDIYKAPRLSQDPQFSARLPPSFLHVGCSPSHLISEAALPQPASLLPDLYLLISILCQSNIVSVLSICSLSVSPTQLQLRWEQRLLFLLYIPSPWNGAWYILSPWYLLSWNECLTGEVWKLPLKLEIDCEWPWGVLVLAQPMAYIALSKSFKVHECPFPS